MHWLGYLAIFTIAFSIKDAIRKRSLNRFDNMAVLSLEFNAAFLIFLLVALFTKTSLVIDQYALTFLGIGVLHGLGTVGKINAMNISLSKTTLVSKYNIVIPMLMGAFFLNEKSLFNFYNLEGIFKIIALLLFPLALYLLRKPATSSPQEEKVSRIWLLSMIQFFVFHATLDFLMKTTADPTLIIKAGVFQRLAAGVTTLIAALVAKAKFPFTKQLFGVATGNGLLIAISYFANLSALISAPLIIYKPLAKMLTLIVITAVGLFIFGERKEITAKTRWGYLVTGLGVLLLVVAEAIELL